MYVISKLESQILGPNFYVASLYAEGSYGSLTLLSDLILQIKHIYYRSF